MERLTLILLAATACGHMQAQEADRALRKGNAEYNEGRLPEAVQAYSDAQKDERGMFNLGNAFYRQDSLADATRSFENAASMAKTPEAQAKAYYNLGNSWMKQKNYGEALNAYKEALKRNPSDPDSRYNLAYAQQMLAREQQQQKQQKPDQNKDKNKDQQDQGGNKDQQNDKQDQQDQQKQDQGKPEDRKEQDGQPKDQQRIDPQDAKRMLDAAQQQEKGVQDKVRELMQPQPKQPADKDW